MRIELQGLCKSYDGRRVLDRVSLEIAPGQIVAVLGENGAGKTTLLRCLAGVIAPASGTIRYDDETFRRDRLELRRRLHFLPDFPFVFANQTLPQQLGLVLRIYGADQSGVEERVVELLRDFDLLTLTEKPLGRLARGQLYKAALVMLLAVDPELWLLDEPFASGMDPHGINAFKTHARQAAGRGRTVLFTTQILEVAERFADRVCILHRGELRAFETVAALQAKAQEGANPLEELFRQLRAEQQ
jgi:ABC-type multidrug transport system ATPase subunit